ncbi:ATP-binding protein [Acidovorax lacteus]|uniref:histidine kinase n=1 Tax=Acidovorax lacteus TaxID=1924988 RepID=A0ABP8L3T1_9BURK
MPSRPRDPRHQRYLLRLAAVTAVMAVVMAVVLALQVLQRQAIAQSAALRSDSVTALAFQLEREFLRLRFELGSALATEGPVDTAPLQLRQELFASRYQLMHDTPSASALSDNAEYQRVMPKVKALVERTDALLAQRPVDRSALRTLVADFQAAGPDVLALTLAANSHVAHLLETQVNTMLEQADQIVWLSLAQLLMLLVAATALLVRQRRQERERLALEQLTRDLSEAHRTAEAANRGKSQFLANMSHELRTPFNGMLGMLTLLEGTPLNAQQGDYVRTARTSASHLLQLLNDILDVSALESGRMGIHPSPVQLGAVMTEVESLMRPLAEGKGLRLEVRLDPQLPPWLVADATRIRQILLNLVSNAIKFSEHGTVRVDVDRLPPQADAAPGTVHLSLQVHDQGIGMDAHTLSKLFQRFSQGDASTSRRFGGTGLGLEISRSLARLMGGDITVSSQPGKGSTFSVHLPLPEGAPPAAQLLRPAAEADLGAPADRPHLSILVAEDQWVNRKYLGELLQRMGHSVRFAQNGQEAVEAVKARTPDVVFMDLHMPLLDGLQATRAIRAMPPPAGAVPVIALTADVLRETRDNAAQAGMSAFLTKPASAEAVTSVLLELFGERATVPASLEPVPAPTPAATPAASPPAAPPPRAPSKKRRFRPGDVAAHIDMAMVGEVCIGVSLASYSSLVQSFFSDESGTRARLNETLQAQAADAAHEAAHALKGAAANLGFHHIAQLARQIEHHCGDAGFDWAGAQQALDQAFDMAQALSERMGLYRAQAPAS